MCDNLRKKTIEDYVEQLYDLQEKDKPVHTNDVANILNINPASVTEIFQKLHSEGYVDYKKYGGVILTKKGQQLAISTRKRHEKLKEFLILLGVNKKIAEKDACEMEHILNNKTMDVVLKFVEVINLCETTPFWLNRLKKYIKTGKLDKCPAELAEICSKYNKN